MRHTESSVREKIRQFIIANMNSFEEVELSDSDNIFQSGFVSSIFAMRLLNFIEKEFSVQVPDDDILLKNFSSVDVMNDMVFRLQPETV
jgi:methoxymalonate biosynthesis acyl carrier protein